MVDAATDVWGLRQSGLSRGCRNTRDHRGIGEMGENRTKIFEPWRKTKESKYLFTDNGV